MTSLQKALQAAGDFLSVSVATETGLPLVKRLWNAIPTAWIPPVEAEQAQVILYALDLLKAIHETRGSQLGVKGWRQVSALVEIVIVLGLYKCLSPGVGIPEHRRFKSILLEQEGQRDVLPVDEQKLLLESIISRFKTMVEDGGEIGESLQRRQLTDIVSGMAELSFNPSFPQGERLLSKLYYEEFLSR